MIANKILLILFFTLLFSFQLSFANIASVIAERESIRIAAFYYLDDASPQLRELISEQLVPAAISYYQATLKVNRLKDGIILDRDHLELCAELKREEFETKRVEADLVLFVRGYKNSQFHQVSVDSFAFAEVCYPDPQTSRVIIGSLYYNLGKELETIQSITTTYESLLLITLHEIGHILGFTEVMYDKFINPLTGEKLLNTTMKKKVNGVMVTVLTLDPLTRRLRDYFACPTLEGAYLEQQGISGSVSAHFERRIFMNELMVAGSGSDQRISEFFLALLEGTGWYTPNYNMSEPLFWGKGKGCKFLNTKCINSARESNFPDHFCTNFGKLSCSFDRLTHSICGSATFPKNIFLPPAFDYWGERTILSYDPFSDNCPYRFPTVDIACQIHPSALLVVSDKEYFGPQSACFTGNLNGGENDNPYCLKQSCKKIGSDHYVVNIEIKGRTVVCQKEGPIKVNDDGDDKEFLNCPDPFTFCTLVTPYFCRRGCMGRGTCVNDQCLCKEGYYGSDCSYREVEKTQAEGFPIHSKYYPTKVILLLVIIFFIFFIFALVSWVAFSRKLRKVDQVDPRKKDI